MKKRGTEIPPLTVEQFGALLETARGDKLEALYILAVSAGMRQGELLGLKWEDVDLEAGALRVRRTFTTTKDDPRLAVPRTIKSRRCVLLAPSTIEALRNHRRRQLEERHRTALWQDNDFVFASETGKSMGRGDMATGFNALLERAGVPRVRFHELRRTCVRLLHNRNVHPKVVSEMLGYTYLQMKGEDDG